MLPLGAQPGGQTVRQPQGHEMIIAQHTPVAGQGVVHRFLAPQLVCDQRLLAPTQPVPASRASQTATITTKSRSGEATTGQYHARRFAKPADLDAATANQRGPWAKLPVLALS